MDNGDKEDVRGAFKSLDCNWFGVFWLGVHGTVIWFAVFFTIPRGRDEDASSRY
jgi:hypothetical protein